MLGGRLFQTLIIRSLKMFSHINTTMVDEQFIWVRCKRKLPYRPTRLIKCIGPRTETYAARVGALLINHSRINARKEMGQTHRWADTIDRFHCGRGQLDSCYAGRYHSGKRMGQANAVGPTSIEGSFFLYLKAARVIAERRRLMTRSQPRRSLELSCRRSLLLRTVMRRRKMRRRNMRTMMMISRR